MGQWWLQYFNIVYLALIKKPPSKLRKKQKENKWRGNYRPQESTIYIKQERHPASTVVYSCCLTNLSGLFCRHEVDTSRLDFHRNKGQVSEAGWFLIVFRLIAPSSCTPPWFSSVWVSIWYSEKLNFWTFVGPESFYLECALCAITDAWKIISYNYYEDTFKFILPFASTFK